MQVQIGFVTWGGGVAEAESTLNRFVVIITYDTKGAHNPKHTS